MNKVYLKIPDVSELHFRQEWMNDSGTMAYNAGYDLDLKGYNKQTSKIEFKKSFNQETKEIQLLITKEMGKVKWLIKNLNQNMLEL